MRAFGNSGLIACGFVVLGAVAVEACIGDTPVLPPLGDDAGATDGSSAGDASCTQCGAECVDTTTDPRHCGTCATVCNPGSVCTASKCALACPTGQVNCSGVCVDPKTNPQHCGATAGCGVGGGSAGAVCAGGNVCNAGTCATSCSAGLLNCGGACIDPATNAQFCGATGACGGDAGGTPGTACTGGKVCSGGVCTVSCPAGQVNCGGTCIDPATNRQFCGASGACTGGTAGTACVAGQLCSGTGCTETCSASQPTACPVAAPTYCANLQTDANNCGACGTKCNAGQQCTATGCACPTATPNACGTGASALCTNFATDPAHCGGCSTVCGAGQVCTNNSCTCAGTNDPDVCGAGASAFCTNFNSDPAHCGNCGKACAAGQVCNSGTCAVVCPQGQTTCGPVNAPYCSPLNNVQDCGTCGNRCGLDKDCSGGPGVGACVPCTPTVSLVSPGSAPPPPPGYKVTCLANGFTGPCPVVHCGQLTYWAFSDVNNGFFYGVTGYDPQNVIRKGPTVKNGDRYINTITLDSAAQTATLLGQGNSPITMAWQEFRLP